MFWPVSGEISSLTKLVAMLAETPIHVGIGQSNAAIDLPVAREASTHFPIVPGSGLKGALRVWAEEAGLANMRRMFGEASGEDAGDASGAGTVICGEARLAMLPVRCLSGTYRYATCPRILRRLLRDLKRAGHSDGGFGIPAPRRGTYLGDGDTSLALEEREFERADDDIATLTRLLATLFFERFASTSEVQESLTVLHDDDFAWFVQFGLPIATRNSLNENKRVMAGHLWTEETLPAETLMWTLLGQRDTRRGAGQADLKTLCDAIGSHPYIQAGGNETIGQGWFHMTVLPASGGTA